MHTSKGVVAACEQAHNVSYAFLRSSEPQITDNDIKCGIPLASQRLQA